MERREEEDRKTTAQRDDEKEEGETEEEGAATGRGGNADEDDDEDSDGDEEQKNKDIDGSDDDDGDKDAAGMKKKTKQKGIGVTSCPDRKCVPGIIYLGHIPPRFRPKHLRNLLSVFGEIGRIFLQPEGSLCTNTHIYVYNTYTVYKHTHKYYYSTYTEKLSEPGSVCFIRTRDIKHREENVMIRLAAAGIKYTIIYISYI